MPGDERDPFVSMMTAASKVTLSLGDFAPQSMLRVPEHLIQRPKFPAIDFHNHIDGMEPAEVLRIMDACGIEHLVNITMKPGTDGIESMARLSAASPNPFSMIAAPSAASARAMPNPIPLVEPVTNATFPFNAMSRSPLFCFDQVVVQNLAIRQCQVGTKMLPIMNFPYRQIR